ncbi:MAG: tetratricopeptide repeat protein [Deltaproteobacteria bacterium]|nr:tetratricopeptide repeat protein [Deltaproteobacteria bacterium]
MALGALHPPVAGAPTWRLFYEPPLDGWLSLPRFLACALLVGALGALCRRALDSMRAPVIFWSGWFVFAVLPTANIFKQETRFAERYALLALPALAGVLGALASTVTDPPRRRRMALAAVAALTALAAVVTVHRGRYYATNHAFLQEWRATDPAPYHALAALGEEAHYASRWAEAERYYRAAVAVDPVAASFVYEPLGLTLEAQGKTAEAIEMYRTALRYRPQSAAARSHLQALAPATPGPAVVGAQDVAALRRQIQQDPNNAIALVNLGVQLTDAGQLDEAVRSYREALRRDAAWSAPPADHVTMRAKAHYNLGRVLALQGHGPEAIAEYRAALVEDPNYAYAHTNLALLLEGTGARDEGHRPPAGRAEGAARPRPGPHGPRSTATLDRWPSGLGKPPSAPSPRCRAPSPPRSGQSPAMGSGGARTGGSRRIHGPDSSFPLQSIGPLPPLRAHRCPHLFTFGLDFSLRCASSTVTAPAIRSNPRPTTSLPGGASLPWFMKPPISAIQRTARPSGGTSPTV